MNNENLDLFTGLAKHADKQQILKEIVLQLEKDTGLDYTPANIEATNLLSLENLRLDLANYLKKIAGQNQTRFMHLIYRVDISQAKMNKMEMNEFYYHQLAEMVLSRIFQKVITRRYLKHD